MDTADDKVLPRRILADRVLVRVDDIETEDGNVHKTAGGIYLPKDVVSNMKADQAQKGTVVMVSPQVAKNNEANPDECVAIGDRIVCSKYAGSDIKYGDVAYKVMRITDIFAID